MTIEARRRQAYDFSCQGDYTATAELYREIVGDTEFQHQTLERQASCYYVFAHALNALGPEHHNEAYSQVEQAIRLNPNHYRARCLQIQIEKKMLSKVAALTHANVFIGLLRQAGRPGDSKLATLLLSCELDYPVLLHEFGLYARASESIRQSQHVTHSTMQSLSLLGDVNSGDRHNAAARLQTIALPPSAPGKAYELIMVLNQAKILLCLGEYAKCGAFCQSILGRRQFNAVQPQIRHLESLAAEAVSAQPRPGNYFICIYDESVGNPAQGRLFSVVASFYEYCFNSEAGSSHNSIFQLHEKLVVTQYPSTFKLISIYNQLSELVQRSKANLESIDWTRAYFYMVLLELILPIDIVPEQEYLNYFDLSTEQVQAELAGLPGSYAALLVQISTGTKQQQPLQDLLLALRSSRLTCSQQFTQSGSGSPPQHRQAVREQLATSAATLSSSLLFVVLLLKQFAARQDIESFQQLVSSIQSDSQDSLFQILLRCGEIGLIKYMIDTISQTRDARLISELAGVLERQNSDDKSLIDDIESVSDEAIALQEIDGIENQDDFIALIAGPSLVRDHGLPSGHQHIGSIDWQTPTSSPRHQSLASSPHSFWSPSSRASALDQRAAESGEAFGSDSPS